MPYGHAIEAITRNNYLTSENMKIDYEIIKERNSMRIAASDNGRRARLRGKSRRSIFIREHLNICNEACQMLMKW